MCNYFKDCDCKDHYDEDPMSQYDLDWFISEISPYGKGEKLKSVRPKNPVAGYVWRMIKFHAGLDYHHPITCFFYLFDYLHSKGIVKKKFNGIFDPEHKKILDRLEPFTLEAAKKLGLSGFTAAQRYKGLLY